MDSEPEKRIELKELNNDKFWEECANDGTIESLAGMMDTPICGLMGVSTCSEKDEWEYYVAVASTKVSAQ